MSKARANGGASIPGIPRRNRRPAGSAGRGAAGERFADRRGFLDSIPALRNRECIICGEGVSIPVRVSFDDLEEARRPASEDPSFVNLWNTGGHGDEDAVLRTVSRWRAQGR